MKVSLLYLAFFASASAHLKANAYVELKDIIENDQEAQNGNFHQIHGYGVGSESNYHHDKLVEHAKEGYIRSGYHAHHSTSSSENSVHSYHHAAEKEDNAKQARILLAKLSWGILSSSGNQVNQEIGAYPFSSVVSFSDGIAHVNSTGVPFFLMSDMSERAQDVQANSKASFTVSQMSELPHGCDKLDPEDPRCAKLTLIGDVVEVTLDCEKKFALKSLFSKHPSMKGWIGNESHKFRVYKMSLKKIILLNGFGGAKEISPEDFLSKKIHE